MLPPYTRSICARLLRRSLFVNDTLGHRIPSTAGRFFSSETSQSQSTPSSPPPPFPSSGSTSQVQQPTASTSAEPQRTADGRILVQYPYFVARNMRGNLPVYAKVKNQGRTQFVELRNVQGDVQALKQDLLETLFPPDAQGKDIKLFKERTHVEKGCHLILYGGPWAFRVRKWLIARGF